MEPPPVTGNWAGALKVGVGLAVAAATLAAVVGDPVAVTVAVAEGLIQSLVTLSQASGTPNSTRAAGSVKIQALIASVPTPPAPV